MLSFVRSVMIFRLVKIAAPFNLTNAGGTDPKIRRNRAMIDDDDMIYDRTEKKQATHT